MSLRQSDRLVIGSVLSALLGVWFVLLGFEALTVLISELDELGEGNYGFWQAVLYTLNTLPRRAYALFPTAAVIAAVLGIGALSASSELTALRALGLSRVRICAGAVLLIAVLTAVMMLVAETIAPAGEQHAQTLAMQAKTSDVATSRRTGLWAREGNVFLNARQGTVIGHGLEAEIELTEVTRYEFDEQGRLQSIATAERARHYGQGWLLSQVRRSRFSERQVNSEQIEQEQWDSALSPDVLSLGITRPRYLPLAELRRSLDYLQRNQLDAQEFESAYWARVFYPLSVLLLCMAAMPFAFGSLRSGGFGKRLFLGVVFGVGMYTVQTAAVNLAGAYHLDLRLAYGLPPVVVALASWWRFRKRL